MAVLDPNVLNPYVLLEPSIAPIVSAIFTGLSIILSLIISWHFFKSYRFSGFGYLLGLPAGFVFLGASFAFELLSLLFRADPFLYPAFFWVQLSLQSEAFALIALSYYYKNSSVEDIVKRGSVQAKHILMTTLPLTMVIIPFIVPTSTLASAPYFNYPGLADLSFYMRIFNMVILAYVMKSAVVSLVKAASIKLLYIPAAFAMLWIEQYSLVITYFDNSTVAFIASTLARIAALSLFVYVMHSVTSKRRIEIEAREKA